MNHEMVAAGMLRIGKLHELLCRVPVVGERSARAISWLFSVFAMLGGMRRTESVSETRDMLRDAGERMGFPFAFSEIEGERFVLELPYCPYGFSRPDQQRPCDTAMDMDRIMLRRCGAELSIEETIPGGASRCKMVVRQG